MLFYFDTSALAKRFHSEPGSGVVDAIFDEQKNRIFTSRLGEIELTSVAAIKVRTGAMSVADASEFIAAVGDSLDSQRIIVRRLLEEDYNRAQTLLTQYAQQHSLRTLDSLHLASALRLRASSHLDFFVTSDKVLAMVAALEGFAVVIPEEV